MNTGIKPALEQGKEYVLEGHPEKDLHIKGTYSGAGNYEGFGRYHVFVHRDKDHTTYILADDHWLREIDGTLTYTPVSSFSILFITDEQIRQLPETKLDRRKSALTKLLNELGEKV